MKTLAWCLALGPLAASAARHASLRASGVSRSVGAGGGAGAVLGSGSGGGLGQVGAKAAISAMVGEMLVGNGRGPKLRDIVATAQGKIGLEEAVQQLQSQLPADVASLARLLEGTGAERVPASEESLQQAREVLNSMLYGATLELDDLIFQSKEFQERNRGTYEQVVADLARLGSQLAALGERRVEAAAGIADNDARRKKVQESLEAATQQFSARMVANHHEMDVRKNGLATFEFVLNATSRACAVGDAFVQLGRRGAAMPPKVSVCNGTKGGLELDFGNRELQAQVERALTPEARTALREALGDRLLLAQLRRAPVSEEPDASGQWKKCVTGQGQDCGLLLDRMSLEWGKFKDGVDELAAEVKDSQQAFDLEKKNFNEQLMGIGDAKTKSMEVLAEAISSINSDTEEMSQRDEQKRDLTQEYDKSTALFRAQITEVLYTKICAVKKVRNALLVNSTVSPPSNVTDCDVSDWESKTGECLNGGGKPILCDNACPRPDPRECGGQEAMKRDVVAAPNANGMQCPPLERQKRCGQIKCPVSCSMSRWSGWSKCTKDCEGGVQTRTRAVVTKPLNGGTACDSIQEERSCNTGSCDRDCSLQDWSDWTPCSTACGGGLAERTRSVLVPVRGQGKCPGKKSGLRFEESECNTQPCQGDEICIARQDLIIALDASGSLGLRGFEILRGFAANLTRRYQSRYFGSDTMKIGAVLFGNGRLVAKPDGSSIVSPAMPVQVLTSDLALVQSQILQTTWQQGFTNMAQAFTMADSLLSQGGRAEAQSALLVLSDGKYSFKYQSAEKLRELKDKNVQVFMAPVTEVESKELNTLKQWASQPWRTNYEHIPGVAALEFNTALFTQKLLVKFCPDSLSPTLLRQQESQRQYMIIHEGGWPSDECGAWRFEGQVATAEDCAQATRARSLVAFAFGKTHAQGRCYSEAVAITQQFWDEFRLEREDPPCPNGQWKQNPFYDTYAINPRTVVSTAA